MWLDVAFYKGEWEVKDIGDVPEVTIVHPCAEGELPASICESSACAPGSAIGPPSMTASSKRTTAAFISSFCINHKNRDHEQSNVYGGCYLPPPPFLPDWVVGAVAGVGGCVAQDVRTYLELLGGLQLAPLPECFGQPPPVSLVGGGGTVEAVFLSETVPGG